VANVPEYTLEPKKAIEWVREGDEVVVRPNVIKRDLGLPEVYFDENTINGAMKGTIFTRYLHKSAEFRVKVVDSKAEEVYIKVPRSGRGLSKSLKFQKVKYSNNTTLEKLSSVSDAPADVVKSAVNAAVNCDMTSAAVSVMWNEFRKECFITGVKHVESILEGYEYISPIKGSKNKPMHTLDDVFAQMAQIAEQAPPQQDEAVEVNYEDGAIPHWG